MTDEILKARVAVPQSKNDPDAVRFEEIPLPPRDMWEGMGVAAPVNKAVSPVAAEPAVSKRPRKALRFTAGEFSKIVPLQFPFEDDELGAVSQITVRRLTVGEVGELIDQRTGGEEDNFDIYASMTGMPAEVLRGLMDVDGEEVTRVCFDFLPPMFRAETSDPSSLPTNGET
ncbi:hypothetical protein [Agrobacterium pusense]|uniref:hypothetical protein n=1 Tax=Agrobacterium pusense TaxID=648995 RepID=UPI000927B081|nr:hypothetical protein [Agrobacterium pusense]OJH56017.1 hypothetical protein BA725_03925 [Agrobacterium pusense]